MQPKRTMTIRMPEALHTGLKELAREQRCSMEAVVRELIGRAVNRHYVKRAIYGSPAATERADKSSPETK